MVSVSLARIIQAHLHRDVGIFVSDPVIYNGLILKDKFLGHSCMEPFAKITLFICSGNVV